MSDTIKVNVIEVEANKLVKDAKYIFTLDDDALDMSSMEDVVNALDRLLGQENFTLLVLPKDSFKAYSIEPKTMEKKA